MFKKIAGLLIGLYQKTISPDHGWFKGLYPHGFCKYYPSCSQYTKEAVNEYGFIKGIVMGAWRICRCNPWSTGGYDPVNKKDTNLEYRNSKQGKNNNR